MSDPRTEEIRARLSAATPGPWEGDALEGYIVSRSGDVATVTMWSDPDASLMIHAPADLAYLLGRIDALEADSDRTHRKIRDLADIAVEATVEYHRLRAVADAARPILDDLRDGEPTPPADVDALESALDALDGA